MARFDLLDSSRGDASVITSGEVLGRLDYIDQVMGHSAAFGERDFCCCDGYSTIDLNGIQIDDLAVARQSQLDAQLAFA